MLTEPSPLQQMVDRSLVGVKICNNTIWNIPVLTVLYDIAPYYIFVSRIRFHVSGITPRKRHGIKLYYITAELYTIYNMIIRSW